MTEPSHQLSPPAPPPSPVAAQAGRPLWTLVGPGLSAVIAACQFAVLLGPLRSAVQRDLGFSNALFAVSVAVTVAAMAAGFALGYLAGRRAPVAIIMSSLALMLVGVILAALSGFSVMSLAASLMIGLGGGAVLGVAVVLVGQAGRRQRQFRLALGLAVLGGLLAGLAFGWLAVSTLGWRPTFLLSAPMVLAALVVMAGSAVGGLTRVSR